MGSDLNSSVLTTVYGLFGCVRHILSILINFIIV